MVGVPHSDWFRTTSSALGAKTIRRRRRGDYIAELQHPAVARHRRPRSASLHSRSARRPSRSSSSTRRCSRSSRRCCGGSSASPRSAPPRSSATLSPPTAGMRSARSACSPLAIYIGLAMVLLRGLPDPDCHAHGLSVEASSPASGPPRSSASSRARRSAPCRSPSASPNATSACPREYASFAVPLGATTKMDGCAAIYPAIAAIFVASSSASS